MEYDSWTLLSTNSLLSYPLLTTDNPSERELVQFFANHKALNLTI